MTATPRAAFQRETEGSLLNVHDALDEIQLGVDPVFVDDTGNDDTAPSVVPTLSSSINN